MKLKRDQITGAVVVLVGIVVLLLVSQFKTPFTLAYPGPKALPTIAAVGFIICGIGVFVESTRSSKEEKTFLVKEGWVRLFKTLILLAVYIFGMKYLGYLIMTPIVCYIITTLYAKGSHSTLKGRLLYTVILTALIYVTYVFMFGMGLPTGELFG